jgi:plasmid stabilization system protein ParE
MEVIWSDEAIGDYQQNIDYLLREWSEQVAIEFVEDVEGVIELIKIHPELYPLTDYQAIRKAVISKQVTLFFKSNRREINLIRFWNSYQDPKKLKL